MIILDTNVISELMKGKKCSENVYNWTSKQPINQLFTTTITMAERWLNNRIRRYLNGT